MAGMQNCYEIVIRYLFIKLHTCNVDNMNANLVWSLMIYSVNNFLPMIHKLSGIGSMLGALYFTLSEGQQNIK